MYRIPKKEYWAVHYWVRKNKVKPKICSSCKKEKKPIWWANVSGKYLKDLNDYIPLCCKCHRKMDYTDEWRRKVSIATRGERNPFFGRKHNKKTKDILRKNAVRRVWKRDAHGHFKKLVSN